MFARAHTPFAIGDAGRRWDNEKFDILTHVDTADRQSCLSLKKVVAEQRVRPARHFFLSLVCRSMMRRMMTECAFLMLAGERANLRPRRLPLRLPGHENLPQLVLHAR